MPAISSRSNRWPPARASAFEQVDICNPFQYERVFAVHQPDAVMHLAAENHVDRSIDGAAAFVETNIVGTYTLLEAAHFIGSRCRLKSAAPFVFIIFPPMKWRFARQR